MILDMIGDTSLVPLRRLVPRTSARILVKLEYESPTGGTTKALTLEMIGTARRLAREEGLFAGTSTGANVAAALRVAAELGAGGTVVTVAVDSGMKYLSTALYAGA